MRLRGWALYPFLFSAYAAFIFCLSVFQTTPSTPGVRFPVFCVTRLTAKSLAIERMCQEPL